MKIQSRFTLWVSIIIAVVIASSFILAFGISEQYSKNTLQRAMDVTSNFILTQAKANLDADDFVPENFEEKKRIFSEFFRGVDTTEILRIKVWSTDGTIVFSDDDSIIGQNYYDNQNFQKSLQGEIAPEIKEPVKPENVAEAGYGQLMELYVPITSGGQIIGIIEIYTSLDFVNSSIQETNMLIFSIASITSLSVAVVVVIVFFSMKRNVLLPILNIQEATKKIANGDFEIKINEKGEDELKDLSKDINMMVNELSKQRKALIHAERLSAIGELAARLAHDLRNPLNVIKYTTEIIKRKAMLSSDKSKNLAHERLDRAIKRISHQIDEVMDFVRIKPLEIHECSIRSILKSSIDTTQIPKSVKVNLPNNDAEIPCDRQQMEIVFVNLISNAIDAMEKSGEIEIRINDYADKTVIEVQDSGPGLPDEKLQRIFDPLYTTKQNGTGLGLVSCKEIIKRHHGTIVAKNNPTTFTITLIKNQVFDYNIELKKEVTI